MRKYLKLAQLLCLAAQVIWNDVFWISHVQNNEVAIFISLEIDGRASENKKYREFRLSSQRE